VGQIVTSFERGAKGRDLEAPNRPCVVQSDVGIASERGKKSVLLDLFLTMEADSTRLGGAVR
jgi:hypothetical protein